MRVLRITYFSLTDARGRLIRKILM